MTDDYERIAELVEEQKAVVLTEDEVRVLTDYHYFEAEKAITRRGDRAAQQRHLERLALIRGKHNHHANS